MTWRIGLLVSIYCGSLFGAIGQETPSALHERRESVSDLEVSGMVRGVTAGDSRYVSRAFLMGLPQVDAQISQIEIAQKKSEPALAIRGVYLDVLAKRLGAEGGATAAAAICKDGYTSTFSTEYIRTHRPVVVLTVDGIAPHDWAVKQHRFDAGPYFVGYQAFLPAFRVLSYTELPAEPDGIKKIVFGTDEAFYHGIRPKRVAGEIDPMVVDGFKIAQQNCYRCHNAGENGGTKAGVSWSAIGSIAKERPDFFEAWVYDPQSMKKGSTMPPNKGYDKATLKALQRYFAPFAEEGE